MWPKNTSIFEVGPRDGLQAEAKILSLDERFRLVEALFKAGLERVEVGSIVRADRIPQLQNTESLLERLHALRKIYTRAKMWIFVPNEFGFDHALAHGVDGISYFVGASETFCQKNVNRTREALLDELDALLPRARKARISMRVYVSTIVFCPYEGITPVATVEKVVKRLVDAGAQEIVLSDTTGHANPRSLERVLGRLLRKIPARRFALHLHDTRGLALANVLQGMQHGISIFDSSIGGMGGCPYAPGATGNLATEDLANLLASFGGAKGIDLGQLGQAGFMAEKFLGKPLPSKVLRTLELK